MFAKLLSWIVPRTRSTMAKTSDTLLTSGDR
jgi:hypothetical protein